MTEDGLAVDMCAYRISRARSELSIEAGRVVRISPRRVTVRLDRGGEVVKSERPGPWFASELAAIEDRIRFSAGLITVGVFGDVMDSAQDIADLVAMYHRRRAGVVA